MAKISHALAFTVGLLVFPALQASVSAMPATALTFSHKLHMSDDVGAECTMCHAAEESQAATDRLLPTMDTCGECHDVEDDESCSMCHKDVDEASEIDLPARKVRFAHKAHLQYEGVGCETCHSGMSQLAQTGGEHTPEMAVCSTCHSGGKAPDACAACHLDVSNLKPKTHVTSWILEHGRNVRAGDRSCAPCHNEATCEECHDAAQISTESAAVGSLAPFAPQSSGSKGLILKAAHSLDYVYTHPLDAKGKERECALCHETESFCGGCHRREAADDAMKPAWHDGPNWGAIAGAVGSGGGRHAKMAKRDMETCAACHGSQGDDPVCVLCHADRTPGLGNDPRTHGSGFKGRTGYGSYHTDPNAICYNCHASGLSGVGKMTGGGPGFCGYCHGAK